MSLLMLLWVRPADASKDSETLIGQARISLSDLLKYD